MMSAARLKVAAPVERDERVVTEARRAATYHAHNLLMDAADALKALARGDDCTADNSLKLVLLACADARSALQPALLPPAPKATADKALEEWG
jgi:hypothetical protein